MLVMNCRIVLQKFTITYHFNLKDEKKGASLQLPFTFNIILTLFVS
jgi:hypothetical protein